MTGSYIQMQNQGCGTCYVDVSGTITLDDDGLGNVLLTDVSLSHGPYETAGGVFLSVVLERTSITLGAGSVAGTGSTISSSVLFGSTTIDQIGTVTCTDGFITCAAVGQVQGPVPMAPNPEPTPTVLGSWNFDALGDLSGSFVYNAVTVPDTATETMFLVGTIVPEPGTGLLLGLGLVGLAVRRRNRA